MSATSLFERIAEDPELSPLQKVLLITDGTVTQLLEVCTGEKLRVKKLQRNLPDRAPEALDLRGDEQALSRAILLHGSRRAYLFAHSWLVPNRMPEPVSEALLTTSQPLGHIWHAHRLEEFREIIDFRREEDAEVGGLLACGPRLLSRTYLVFTGGRPVAHITEKISASLFT